jgi:hypothetical protein
VNVLSEEVLTFILIWVSPAALMTLFQYPTRRFDQYAGALLAAAIIMVPLSQLLYAAYPVARLYAVYMALVSMFSYLLVRRLGYPLTQALSLASCACLLSSYYWETPWIIRNLVVYEWAEGWRIHLLDWIVSSLGIFYLWFLAKATGFRATLGAAAFLGAALLYSVGWMLLLNVPPGFSDALVWNQWGMMVMRMVAAVAVFNALNVRRQPT